MREGDAGGEQQPTKPGASGIAEVKGGDIARGDHAFAGLTAVQRLHLQRRNGGEHRRPQQKHRRAGAG